MSNTRYMMPPVTTNQQSNTDPADAAFVPCNEDTWRNPFDMYAALREHDPVHYVSDGDYWVLSRFDDIFNAARNTKTFSSAEGLTFNYGEREALDMDFAPMVMLDPPEHTAFRRMVGRGFTPRRVQTIEPLVRDFVVEYLGRLADGGTGDFAVDFAKPLPSFVVALYLGVPEEDRGSFDRWTDSIVAANAQGENLQAIDAVAELALYFSELVERRKAEPGDDVVSELVALMQDGEEMDLLSILGFTFTMVAGGNDTTTGLLGGAAELLTDNPDQRALLAEDPSLIDNAVEEFLRLTSPVQGLARTATRDVEIRGRTIPAGRKVFLAYGSANRDPDEFGVDAEELDVTRNIERIMTFGYGAHHCLGAATARLQARVALEELLARHPDFTVDAAAGRFAGGHFVRRYASLPFTAGPAA
ncbi:MAG: cytochrome P450 [Actinomycetia bacterium]|nr:cytochrome P450 [Actinomycetes bacterium]